MAEKLCAASCFLVGITLLASAIAAQETTSFLISWQPNPEPNITRYVIYRSTDAASGFTPIDSVAAGTHTYIDSGRLKGTRYFYRLVAKNDLNEASPMSNPVSGLTIPDNANPALKAQCQITGIDSIYAGTYDVRWSTTIPSIGFVQYDTDQVLDSISAWDDDSYATNLTVRLEDLLMPRTYYARAISYDNVNNMTVSIMDSFAVNFEPTIPPTAPMLSIYPVPYHPRMGRLSLDNLPPGGSVTVYNEKGLEVFHRDVGTEDSITWDGLNMQGGQVMSGVYYVVTKDSKGNVTDKRSIMIVR